MINYLETYFSQRIIEVEIFGETTNSDETEVVIRRSENKQMLKIRKEVKNPGVCYDF